MEHGERWPLIVLDNLQVSVEYWDHLQVFMAVDSSQEVSVHSRSLWEGNLFKQCLFRIEIQQGCDINVRAAKLVEQKKEIEIRLRKAMTDSSSADKDNSVMKNIKDELEVICKDIEENLKQKKIQDENNDYE